jgi:hypothetical protein
MDSPESLRGIPMTRRCWLRRGMHHKVAFWNASLVGRVFAPRARRPPGGIVRVPDIIDRLREVAPLGALGPQAPLEPLGQLCLVGAGRRDGGSTRPLPLASRVTQALSVECPHLATVTDATD